MLFPRLAIAVTAVAVVLVLLIAPNLLLRDHSGAPARVATGYCVDVTGPEGSGWGGATVCTPDTAAATQPAA